MWLGIVMPSIYDVDDSLQPQRVAARGADGAVEGIGRAGHAAVDKDLHHGPQVGRYTQCQPSRTDRHTGRGHRLGRLAPELRQGAEVEVVEPAPGDTLGQMLNEKRARDYSLAGRRWLSGACLSAFRSSGPVRTVTL